MKSEDNPDNKPETKPAGADPAPSWLMDPQVTTPPTDKSSPAPAKAPASDKSSLAPAAPPTTGMPSLAPAKAPASDKSSLAPAAPPTTGMPSLDPAKTPTQPASPGLTVKAEEKPDPGKDKPASQGNSGSSVQLVLPAQTSIMVHAMVGTVFGLLILFVIAAVNDPNTMGHNLLMAILPMFIGALMAAFCARNDTAADPSNCACDTCRAKNTPYTSPATGGTYGGSYGASSNKGGGSFQDSGFSGGIYRSGSRSNPSGYSNWGQDGGSGFERYSQPRKPVIEYVANAKLLKLSYDSSKLTATNFTETEFNKLLARIQVLPLEEARKGKVSSGERVIEITHKSDWSSKQKAVDKLEKLVKDNNDLYVKKTTTTT